MAKYSVQNMQQSSPTGTAPGPLSMSAHYSIISIWCGGDKISTRTEKKGKEPIENKGEEVGEKEKIPN